MDSPQGKQEVCPRLSVWQKWWRLQSTCHHFRNTVLHITHRILCIDQLNLKNCISHNRRAKLLYVFAITSDLHFCPLLEAPFYGQFGSHWEWATLFEEALHSSGPDDAAAALSTAGWFTCLSTTWSEHSVELKTKSFRCCVEPSVYIRYLSFPLQNYWNFYHVQYSNQFKISTINKTSDINVNISSSFNNIWEFY